MTLSRSQRIALFVAIACSGSWALAWMFWALGGEWGTQLSKPVGVLYMVPPALAALVVQGPVTQRRIAEPFGLRFPRSVWFLIGWVLPAVVLAAGFGVLASLGYDLVTTGAELADVMRERTPAQHMDQLEERLAKGGPPSPWTLVLWALIAGLTIDLVLSLGEELGWRGFLLADMPGSFWSRTAGIGVIWGLWYVPLVAQGHLYPDHPGIGTVMIVAWTLLWSPTVAYVRLRARSLFAACALRGTAMALWHPGANLVRAGSDLMHPLYGFPGLLAATVVLILLWLHDHYLAPTRIMGKIGGAEGAHPSPGLSPPTQPR